MKHVSPPITSVFNYEDKADTCQIATHHKKNLKGCIGIKTDNTKIYDKLNEKICRFV